MKKIIGYILLVTLGLLPPVYFITTEETWGRGLLMYGIVLVSAAIFVGILRLICYLIED